MTITPLKLLTDQFEERENIKIHVLKSARENKKEVKNYSEEILDYLGNKFTARCMGFCIFLKKWRKPRK